MFGRNNHLGKLKKDLRADLITYTQAKEKAMSDLVHARVALRYNEGYVRRMGEHIANIEEELSLLEDVDSEVS